MILYKYMARKFLDAFMEQGAVRIGTLYEYREQEQHGAEIGDQDEGKQFTALFLPTGGLIDMAVDTPASRHFRHLLPQVTRDQKIVLAEGAVLNSVASDPDCYTYCVSSEFNRDAMQRMGYDSCLASINPDGFFKAISQVIRHSADFLHYQPISYHGRHTYFLRPYFPVPPSLRKSREYAYQTEVRAIWTPLKERVRPLIVKVPNAVKYCRRLPTR